MQRNWTGLQSFVNDKRLGQIQHGHGLHPHRGGLLCPQDTSLQLDTTGTRALCPFSTTVHTHSEHSILPYSIPRYSTLQTRQALWVEPRWLSAVSLHMALVLRALLAESRKKSSVGHLYQLTSASPRDVKRNWKENEQAMKYHGTLVMMGC